VPNQSFFALSSLFSWRVMIHSQIYFLVIRLAPISLALSKHCRIDLLTAFSSTTKRNLQPRNDKLLIGGQQFLISVRHLPHLVFP